MSTFFSEHIDLVYFFYGLAFFSMGLAIWLESRRASEFRLAGAMVFLAGFGLIHGMHEWFDMFIRMGKFDDLSAQGTFFFNGMRLGELALSFSLLIVFGIRLIFSDHAEDQRGVTLSWMAAGVLTLFWVVSTALTRWVYNPSMTDFVTGADVLARYILGIPGAMLAAWAIFLEQRAFRARKMPDFGKALLGAAVALILYGLVGQVFVTPSFLFPANIINSALFLQVFGFPVQLFRATMGMVMAIFVIRALRVFEVESREKLAMANEARLLAQQAALTTQEKARIETDLLNQELQTAVQELSILYELSRNLAATLDRDTLLQSTINKIFDSLPRIGGGMILLREKPGRPLELIARSGYKSVDGNGVQTFDCTYTQAYLLGEYVANTGRLAWCDGLNIIDLGETADIIADYNNPTISVDASGHTIGVPLTVQSRTAGSMVLSVNPFTEPFSQRDLSLIIAVAGQLSIAIENVNLYQAVQEREALRGELLHQVVAAQEKERQRIARELHDSTGQTLTALGLGLAAASENLHNNPITAAAQLVELRSLSSHALQEIHDMVADLRPSLLDNLGLVSALRSQVQAFERRSKIAASFSVGGLRRRLDPDVEMSAFRIAQEALTNVYKHAQATEVKVRIIFREDRLCLRVRDNGRGFDPDTVLDAGMKERESWGLLGMQERVSLVGGTFFIRSRPTLGTIIQVCIPLAKEDVADVEDKTLVSR
ncbi:MAG: GAF domain-containing sensor histidine kinase [Chloroflexi bacterium]|nr:GAF domain-containing sensor histidine kinase [Chloroflexota bacterium]